MTTHTPTTTQARDAWEAVADDFDRHTTPLTLPLGEAIVARLGIHPGARVLDVAAGSGALSIPAARAGAVVSAVDIAPTMVDRLIDRAGAENLRLHAWAADGTALDIDDDSFDVTMSLNGISVFGDLERGLREAVRVTRPGGQVAIGAFAPLPEVEFVAFFLGALQTAADESLSMPPGPLPPFRLADPDVFAATLRDAGLNDVTIETMSWDVAFTSADHHLASVLGSNPIAARLLAGLDDEQRDRAARVLDGMLRERSGGEAGATLRNRVHLGRGVV